MVDVRIKNGDVVKDSAGRFDNITGNDALFQRALICIGTRLGSFIYDRNIGSYIGETEFDGDDAAERAELVINEALAQFEDTYAEVIEYGEVIKLKITIGSESRNEEVRLNGYV